MPVTRLNHAVLYVRDLEQSVTFYQTAFGFEVIATEPRAGAAFLRAAGSDNHHDLGLFEVGANAPAPPAGAVGLYHLAWEVERIEDLAAARQQLGDLGALRGESSHGATKSLYGADPSGNEFEVMWLVPRKDWGVHERSAVVERLDLQAELARYGSIVPPLR